MSYQFKNITVLVVETSKPIFDLTKAVLQTFGCNQIYSAFGYEEGFNRMCTLNPDLVIIDWLDEPNNGMELTKKIRRESRSPNPFVPIILMTGYSQKRRVIAARDAGITEFVVKPFTANALYQRIEQLIEAPRDFVRAQAYFGPDRRRKKDAEYKGADRRQEAQNTQRFASDKAREMAQGKRSTK